MSLLDLMESDNAFLLEDCDLGFNRRIDLEEPNGIIHQVVGQYTRVAVEVDPVTGAQVPANKSSVTVRLASLDGAIPAAGWTVTTKDITGSVVTGKIPKTGEGVYPDRTLGRVTILFKAE